MATDKSMIRDCRLMESDGYRAMKDWIAPGDTPIAILPLTTGPLSVQCRRWRKRALKIGEDIAIVGTGTFPTAICLECC